MSYLVLEQYGEGQTKGDEEDGEDAQRLEQCGQDLQEHHHVNPEHVKPRANRSQCHRYRSISSAMKGLNNESLIPECSLNFHRLRSTLRVNCICNLRSEGF